MNTRAKIKRLGRAFFYFGGVTGLEGERKENSPVDCFPRESHAIYSYAHAATNEQGHFTLYKQLSPRPKIKVKGRDNNPLTIQN